MGVAGPLVAGVLLSSCGPSLRFVQQSQVYFEYCTAADVDARVPSADKVRCWQAWLAHYADYLPQANTAYARSQIDLHRAGPVATPSERSPFVPGLAPALDAAPDRVCGPPRARCLSRCKDGSRACEDACEGEHFHCLAAFL